MNRERPQPFEYSARMARILIAEDNHDIRRLLERIFERRGFEVESVSDGAQAIAKIDSNHYDAILLDYMMPIASGADVIEWIAEHRPEVGKSCVIVVTAAVRALEKVDLSQVYGTLTKPFDLVEVRELVEKCISDKAH